MKCKFCGEEFVQNLRGKKKEYCSKEECIRLAKNEAQRKWYANKLKTLNGSKNRIIEYKTEKRIVYSSTDRAINSINNQDFSDVIELARKLGAVRFEILEKIKECSEKQSYFDKQDEVFLHQLEEFAKKDKVYADDILQAFKEHIDKRQNRRVIKDKEQMYKHLIQGLIANPNAYVSLFIKDRDKRSYNPRFKEEV